MSRPTLRDVESPLWQKYLIEAAISYYNDRGIKPGLVIDNALLQDGVLDAKKMEGHHEFVLCMAPGYITQLSYTGTEMVVTARFDSLDHTLRIPYYTVRGIIAIGVGALLDSEGHTNVIKVPPLIYPKQSKQETVEVPAVDPIEISTLEYQPPQEDLVTPQMVANR